MALQYRALRVDDDSGQTDFRLFALPASVTWDKRDDQNDAKRGYWLSGGVTPFVGLQDETGSGAQITAEGRAYYSFGQDDRFTLAGRARLGTVAAPTSRKPRATICSGRAAAAPCAAIPMNRWASR